jgi:uncharacterized protein YaaN involved in tellurite resistance
MYEENLGYFRNLSLYIIAGKKRLERAKQGELKALKDKADQSTNIEDSQKLKDFQDLCIRFEKKIFDLELTRNICIQMGPQIRLVQNNDIILADKIQSSIINTIPLWKNQMVLNLGIEHSKRALNAQKMVTDMTNQLLKTNADLLKTNTLETAKESERAMVDIETIEYTNNQLISTLEDVIKIQEEGKQNREDASIRLNKIENELKQKLLSLKD